MKRFVKFFIFTLLVFNVSAQKEVFFNTEKPKDIKVASLQGLETRFSLLPSGFRYSYLPDYYNPSVYIGYFNEKRIADCWILNATIGLHNVETKGFILEKDPNGNLYGSSDRFKYNYALILELGIEPRWYFGYKKRFQYGKAQLNTGWFVSFPMLFQTTLLRTPEPLLNQGWIPNYFTGQLIITPSFGFRQAMSSRLFIEGSVGLGAMSTFGTNSLDNKFLLSNPYLYPKVNIKAAYTFN